MKSPPTLPYTYTVAPGPPVLKAYCLCATIEKRGNEWFYGGGPDPRKYTVATYSSYKTLEKETYGNTSVVPGTDRRRAKPGAPNSPVLSWAN